MHERATPPPPTETVGGSLGRSVDRCGRGRAGRSDPSRPDRSPRALGHQRDLEAWRARSLFAVSSAKANVPALESQDELDLGPGLLERRQTGPDGVNLKHVPATGSAYGTTHVATLARVDHTLERGILGEAAVEGPELKVVTQSRHVLRARQTLRPAQSTPSREGLFPTGRACDAHVTLLGMHEQFLMGSVELRSVSMRDWDSLGEKLVQRR